MTRTDRCKECGLPIPADQEQLCNLHYAERESTVTINDDLSAEKWVDHLPSCMPSGYLDADGPHPPECDPKCPVELLGRYRRAVVEECSRKVHAMAMREHDLSPDDRIGDGSQEALLQAALALAGVGEET